MSRAQICGCRMENDMSKNNYTDDDIEIIYWGEDEEEEKVKKVVDSAEKISVED